MNKGKTEVAIIIGQTLQLSFLQSLQYLKVLTYLFAGITRKSGIGCKTVPLVPANAEILEGYVDSNMRPEGTLYSRRRCIYAYL